MRLDRGHGSPYDRGSADSYYRRPPRPHYFVDGSYTSQEVTELTIEEAQEYYRGFEDNEASQNFKDWG